MVLIICTKNELNLTNRYWDMVLDVQKVRPDRRRQNYIPKTLSGEGGGGYNIPPDFAGS